MSLHPDLPKEAHCPKQLTSAPDRSKLSSNRCKGGVVSARSAVLTALLIAGLVVSAPSVTAATIRLTEVGTPTWTPVDFHIFTAPVGTAATGYVEIDQPLASLLPLPEHASHPDLGIGPGTPHNPPYDQELANGVGNAGLVDQSVFLPSEFSNGMGVYVVFMVVPRAGAPTGSSPDFASGPIIPNSLFPMQSSAETHRNGALFSAPFGFTVPPLDAINPPFPVEGHSHFPLFFIENFDSALQPQLGPAGNYELMVTLTDTAGNGWQATVPYQVVPEPQTAVTLGLGLLACVVGARRYRRLAIFETTPQR